ncbi:MAG: bifunctional phosphopantothenoylcysteine decarboxylase/phosphopantothenate--cysteine ligase CoaBC, partial [Gemmatimonadota bacterium]|nr:bifunctional phosphopantothenoylcysteine decarboxylase/phosphopantothenate--cysteine ligase CoaBC [Gemmatimonadota bacterium]
MLSGRRVILGVSGGIACYKSCTLARRLTEVGAKVDVIMTSSAERFVGSVTFEALTQRPVFTSLWKPGAALAHVTLAQEADVVVVAPATANLIAKANQGLADDFLTSLLLANEKPVILAPAMNDAMYAHPATQQNLSSLKSRGWVVVGPEVGPLAEGPSDKPGRMTEPESIIPWIAREIGKAGSRLSGRKVVVTAGPTREDIDPVRLITNRSSGKMGYAIAEQVFQRGAEVVLVTGPTALAAPVGVKTVSVENTAEMEHAVSENLEGADALIMAAAPADYRVDSPAAEKRPRSKG